MSFFNNQDQPSSTSFYEDIQDRPRSERTSSQTFYDRIATPKRQHQGLKFPDDLDTDGNGNIIRFKIALPEGSKYLGQGQYRRAVDPQTGQTQTTNYRSDASRGSIARRFASNYIMTTTTIDLYMPPQIQSSYQTEWNSTDLGVVGAGIDGGMGLFNSESLREAGGKIADYVKNTLGTSMLNTVAGTLQALTPLNTKDAKSVMTSTAPNPYMEVLFNGVQNRTFSFTFKMIPRSRTEQMSIKKIVDEFKFHQAPEFKNNTDNMYMLFPSEFDIQFLHRNGPNPWLFKISTCALTNVEVNFSPEGQYASHGDGSPFATELTLSFTELEILTKERHKQGY